MARKGKNHKRPSMTIPLGVVAGFIPLVANTVGRFQREGWNGAMREISADTIGLDPASGVFNIKWMMRGTAPIIGGIMVHKLASILGVNRAMARAKIPFIRI